MECVPTKRNRKRKKKRHGRKRLRDRIAVEIEVRSSKRQKIIPEHINTFGTRRTSATIMQADAFWKNYTAAQEWQTKHNVIWWRSRCMALEYENEILRDKIKSLANQFQYPDIVTTEKDYQKEDIKANVQDEDAEEFEFTVTEEMLSFFEKSERHKREMKQKYKSNKATPKKKSLEEKLIVGTVSDRARKEEANELYGEASSKILAMEAALQATLDNYKDKAKPQFWPNIPFKP